MNRCSIAGLVTVARAVLTFLLAFLFAATPTLATEGQTKSPQRAALSSQPVEEKEHYVIRGGLRIYLWEKYREDLEQSFPHTGKVVLLVHGGTRSGRSLYDLQIRDYSLMDFLAKNE